MKIEIHLSQVEPLCPFVAMSVSRPFVDMRINAEPSVEDGDAVGMAMGTDPLLVEGIGGIGEAEDDEEERRGIFEEESDIPRYPRLGEYADEPDGDRGQDMA